MESLATTSFLTIELTSDEDILAELSSMDCIDQSEITLPCLFQSLLEPDYRVRAVAAFGLKKMGDAGVDLAISMLADANSLIRERSCELLGMIGCLDNRVIEALIGASVDCKPKVRAAARRALTCLEQFATD